MVPKTWIIYGLKMYKICEKNHKLNKEGHERLKGRINCRKTNMSGSENPKRQKFWRLGLPLLFVIEMFPLNYILKKFPGKQQLF